MSILYLSNLLQFFFVVLLKEVQANVFWSERQKRDKEAKAEKG